jgi:hypothetical protein
MRRSGPVFRAFASYIAVAGSPAMAINGRRKPGSSIPRFQRLHLSCLLFGPSAGISAIGGNGC